MRNIVSINHGWFFSKEATAVPETLCTDWEAVNVPHCWNAVDGQDGGNDYWRGTAYYAKTITKAELPAAERYYLEIQGANSSADVYLGGKHLAHHDGGYSTWRVDLTEDLAEESLLVIAVDNAANDRVYPQMADFTFYGGLYRNVNIIAVPESHFDLDYYGTPGIKVTPVMEGSDAKTVAENMKAGIDTRKWICVEANDVMAAGYGDVVMFIMLDNGNGMTAQSFVDAFAKVVGAELDFVI